MKIALSLIIFLTISLQNMAQTIESSIRENSEKYINLIEASYFQNEKDTSYQYEIEKIFLDTGKQLLVLGILSTNLRDENYAKEIAYITDPKKPPYILTLIDLTNDSLLAILDIGTYSYLEKLQFTKDYIVGEKLFTPKVWKQSNGQEVIYEEFKRSPISYRINKNSNIVTLTFPSKCLGECCYDLNVNLDAQ